MGVNLAIGVTLRTDHAYTKGMPRGDNPEPTVPNWGRKRDTNMWEQFLIDNGFWDKGWMCDPDGAVFYCPEDGNGIEPDGVCYCGERSPLLQAGMI
jgi:hypothetical protein